MDLGTEGFMRPEHAVINAALRKRSGTVAYDDKLTSFLYELMRDHLPPGVVEELVRDAELGTPTVVFSNGWLATYAHDLAKRLTDENLNTQTGEDDESRGTRRERE